MAETLEITDKQLAMLLEVSRDFALQQLAEAGGFLPFATQARPDGEMEFVRVADDSTTEALAGIFERLRATMAERVQQGEVIAVAMVANILASGAEVAIAPEFERAIRVHVETAGYSRVVIAPYRIGEAEETDGKPPLIEGTMVAFNIEPSIFVS